MWDYDLFTNHLVCLLLWFDSPGWSNLCVTCGSGWLWSCKFSHCSFWPLTCSCSSRCLLRDFACAIPSLISLSISSEVLLIDFKVLKLCFIISATKRSKRQKYTKTITRFQIQEYTMRNRVKKGFLGFYFAYFVHCSQWTSDYYRNRWRNLDMLFQEDPKLKK